MSALNLDEVAFIRAGEGSLKSWASLRCGKEIILSKDEASAAIEAIREGKTRLPERTPQGQPIPSTVAESSLGWIFQGIAD